MMEKISEGRRKAMGHLAYEAFEEGQNLEDILAYVKGHNAVLCDPPLAEASLRVAIRDAASVLMRNWDLAEKEGATE